MQLLTSDYRVRTCDIDGDWCAKLAPSASDVQSGVCGGAEGLWRRRGGGFGAERTQVTSQLKDSTLVLLLLVNAVEGLLSFHLLSA